MNELPTVINIENLQSSLVSEFDQLSHLDTAPKPMLQKDINIKVRPP
jgi:hypothetical protein